MRGLRARLAGWAAITALLATGAPGLWLTWQAYRSLQGQAYVSQLALAQTLAAEIDGELGQAIGAVGAVAERPSALKDASRLASRLALASSEAERLDDLLVSDRDGNVIMRAPHEDTPPAFDPQQQRLMVRQALAQRGQITWEVHHEEGGAPVLRLARAMGPKAAVLGQVRLESLGVDIQEDLKLGDTGFAYLVDEEGKPVFMPDAARRIDGEDRKQLAFTFSGESFVRPEPGLHGTDLLAAYPLGSLELPKGRWAVAVRRSQDEAEGPARHMRRELLLLTAVAVMLGGLLALSLAQPLVNSLLALATAAGRIEEGTLDPAELERLPAQDEVGQLARALAHLARALRLQQAERERAHSRALAAERRLARSERLAVLGQLSAGLAHELNNPLMVIHGAAGEAAQLSPKAAQPWLERVRRESDRCSRLVRELLDYARPKPPHVRDFDLALLARESFESARTGREGAYQLQVDAPRPRVRGDRDQFHQMLVNLMGNAMDAMPEGGPLDLELGQQGATWVLRLRDRGPGIPPRARETVFRPFYTSKTKGTGLGLAICRSLMTGHGGHLRCVGVRGKGACFEATWPRQKRGSHA
ncbi:MAG TPA: sensor histidine kinase [bacterium]|nr:sensor histidine kinase [bacterium]